MFSTLMFERHNTKTAIFGGKPGEPMQYKGLSSRNSYAAHSTELRVEHSGMAGNQVLDWVDLDTEIKTANLKNVSVVFWFESRAQYPSFVYRIRWRRLTCRLFPS